MKIKSISKGHKHAIAFKSLIIIFTFLSSIIVAPVVFQGAGLSFAADNIPGSFAELVKKADPGVVNVSVEKTTEINQQFSSPFGSSPFGENDPYNEFFRRFFGDQMPREYTQRGIGTGFIIDKEGYILTNNHVVEGADKVTVILSDEREFAAEVIGLDSKTDLALIKIENAKDLKPLTLGDSDKLEVGDWVVAIGNPFGLNNTVTVGIVSAKYRRSLGTATYEDYIQTDAAINQGNSGGPLMNTDGKVIGINSNIYSQTGGSIGIGFAIPINMAKSLLPQLKKGKVVRGWMGVTIQPVTPDIQSKFELEDTNGALVASVVEGGPADKAGIEIGDVIVSFDGKDTKDSNELPLIVTATPVGKDVKVEVIRNGAKKTLELEVGELQETGTTSQTQTFRGRGNNGSDLGLRAGEITAEIARQYNLTERSGVMILQVDNGSAAEDAGLQVGDVVLEVDREKITDISQFNRKIRSYKEGDTILFLIKREGTSLFLTLKVEE